MKTITLQIDNKISEKFAWLLGHFSSDEIKVLEQSEYENDDTYLRTIPSIVDSINEARKEPIKSGVKLENLDW